MGGSGKLESLNLYKIYEYVTKMELNGYNKEWPCISAYLHIIVSC